MQFVFAHFLRTLLKQDVEVSLALLKLFFASRHNTKLFFPLSLWTACIGKKKIEPFAEI